MNGKPLAELGVKGKNLKAYLEKLRTTSKRNLLINFKTPTGTPPQHHRRALGQEKVVQPIHPKPLGVHLGENFMVLSVVPGSVSEKAGVKVGDSLVGVNGKHRLELCIRCVDDFKKYCSTKKCDTIHFNGRHSWVKML